MLRNYGRPRIGQAIIYLSCGFFFFFLSFLAPSHNFIGLYIRN